MTRHAPGTLTHRLRAIAGRALRTPRPAAPTPNKHSDHDLAAMRPWSPDDVVFDVGANDGRTVLRIYELLNRPRMYAFEPVSSTYRVLVERTQHLSNVAPRQLAIGAAAGTRDIYLNEIAAMNSFAPHWTEKPLGKEAVTVTTVDDQMRAERIPFVHYLKIDTEGAELEVLHGAEAALRSQSIGVIQLEVGVDQIPKPFVSLETARAYLAERGYRLYGIYNQCRTKVPASAEARSEAAGGVEVLAYCDALFVGARS